MTTELAYERRGTGPPVLLLHGWCLNRSLWTYAQEDLAHHHDVVVPDLAGFGGSSSIPGPYQLDRLADDVDALIEELGVQGATVVGFAFGAAVAIRLASRENPTVAGAALIGVPSAAHAPYERMPAAMRADWPDFARRSAKAVLGRQHSDATVDWLAQMFAGTPLAVAIETVGVLAAFEPEDEVGALRVPTLFVHGAEDQVVPTSISKKCAQSAPGARLEVVEESGHLVPIDQPAALHRLLTDFINETNPGGVS